MIVRIVLMATLAVGAGVAPMTASAEPRRPSQSGAAASDATNQALIETLYRAFAAGDGATISSLLAPDLVWIEAEGHPYADRNPYNGPDAVFEGLFARIGAEYEGFAATPTSILPSGNRVVALGRYTGINRATGEALDAQFAHVFTISGGKVTRLHQYTDTAQWIDVVTPD